LATHGRQTSTHGIQTPPIRRPWSSAQTSLTSFMSGLRRLSNVVRCSTCSTPACGMKADEGISASASRLRPTSIHGRRKTVWC
jgi:hypothetical protein